MADVSVELGMNAQELYQELQNVTAKFVSFAGTTTQSGEKAGQGFAGGFKGGLGGLGANITQALGAIGIGREIKEVIEYGARIQDLADRFGIGAETLQRFGNAAEKNGSSLEAVAKGYRFLEVAQAKALGGNQGMVKAFDDLGISVADLQTKRPDELMLKLGDSSLNAADVVKVLGKSALELRPVLAGLADGTIQFGDAISGINIKGLKEADDAFKTLHQTITIALGGAVAAGLENIKSNMEEYIGHVLAGLERIKGYGASVVDFFKGDLKQSSKDVTVANENAENFIKQAGIGTEQRREEEKTQKKRDLGETPETTETGQFDEQGRPISGGGGGGGGKSASKIESLKEQTDKEEEQQRINALDGQEKINDLKQKAKALQEEIQSVVPRAGQEEGPEEEELKLQLKKDYLEATKQIAAEEKKLEAETEKSDRAAAQNEAALASAKEITKEMQLRAAGDEEGARQAAIRAKYEKEIAAALDRKNPNPALAAELGKQEHEALVNERGRELAKTPAQRAAEQTQAREHQRQRSLAEASLKDEADRRRRGSYTGPGGGPEHSGLTTTGLESSGLGPALSDEAFHDQFKPKGLQFKTSLDDFHKQFQPRGITRSDELKRSAIGKDAAEKDKHVPIAQKQLTTLEKIEKNTQGVGVNK